MILLLRCNILNCYPSHNPFVIFFGTNRKGQNNEGGLGGEGECIAKMWGKNSSQSAVPLSAIKSVFRLGGVLYMALNGTVALRYSSTVRLPYMSSLYPTIADLNSAVVRVTF